MEEISEISKDNRRIWTVAIIIITVIIVLTVLGSVIMFFFFNNILKFAPNTEGLEMEDAKNIGDRFYSCLMNKDYDCASKFYDKNSINNERMSKLLIELDSKLGKIKNYSIVGSIFNFTAKGQEITFNYKVIREKYISEDSIRLYRTDTNESFLISYYTSSQGLL